MKRDQNHTDQHDDNNHQTEREPQTRRRLALHRETLQSLTADQLRVAAGGKSGNTCIIMTPTGEDYGC